MVPGISEGACPTVWEPFVGAFAWRLLQSPFPTKTAQSGAVGSARAESLGASVTRELARASLSSRFRGARSPLCPATLASQPRPIPLCRLSLPAPCAPTQGLCQAPRSQRVRGSPAGHHGTSLASRWCGSCRRACRLRFTQVQSLHTK